MEIDLSKKLNLVQGDCLKVMKSLPSDSVDLIVTDPPYGYSFMNKDWDKAVPRIEIWRECLRVLKAGAFAFVMSAPRSDVQAEMILKLKEAGFEVSFTPIYWAYASGFPKALNISNMIAKREGAKREGAGTQGNTFPLTNEYNDFVLTDNAKQYEGLFGGFQPKPAVEIILVAMKPLSEKTFVEQALKNGHGGTWLGKCRIPYATENDKQGAVWGNDFHAGKTLYEGGFTSQGENRLASSDGRFPANLLVSNNALDNGEITEERLEIKKGGFGAGVNTFGAGQIESERGYNDEGQFSRYFSLDAWWEQQIKTMPKQMREPLTKTFPFIIEPKASKGEKNEGCEELEGTNNCGAYGDGIGNVPKIDGKRPNEYKNFHPTVKPVDLMSYLVTLGSQKNEIVLDPFVGSETTLIAANTMNRKAIGIELQKEYFDIAKARIKTYEEQTRLF